MIHVLLNVPNLCVSWRVVNVPLKMRICTGLSEPLLLACDNIKI